MLRTQNIVCRYNGTVALSGATVSLAAGEFVALVGPNGAGKSTLLRALSRVLEPREGRVLFGERDLYRDLGAREAARAIAVVPQETPLEFDYTGEEVVAMGRHPHLGPLEAEGPRDREAVRRAMERTATWDLRDRPVTKLSGGERRRVLIARAFAQEPAFLLLDEPTSHLDVRYQVEMLSMAKGFGGGVLAVLHDLNLALAYATRVVLMSEGRVRADGAPREVLTQASLDEVFGPHVALRDGYVVPRVG